MEIIRNQCKNHRTRVTSIIMNKLIYFSLVIITTITMNGCSEKKHPKETHSTSLRIDNISEITIANGAKSKLCNNKPPPMPIGEVIFILLNHYYNKTTQAVKLQQGR